MARFNRSARASWPVLAVVIVVAAGVWGLYAWKYAAPSSTTPMAATDTPPADAPPGGGHMTALRATRPTGAPSESLPADNELGGLSSSVGVNAPTNLDGEGIEITLKNSAATAKPSPPTPRPASPSIVTPAVPSESSATLAKQVENGRHFLARGDLLAARSAFSASLDRGLPVAREAELRGELERISNALLFSKATNTHDPLTSVRTIEAGDSIHALARQNRVTDELVMSINGVSEPNRLAVGQRLKLIEGPFRVVIVKSQHRMDVYLGEVFVRSFRVGLGTNGGTPTGTWVVRNKLANPDWTDPRNGRHYLADDPDNPIGERWIGLEGVAGEAVGKQGFGIHGTIEPSSIGENLSMGCIRLVPEDVIKVYDLLVERYSQVEIRP